MGGEVEGEVGTRSKQGVPLVSYINELIDRKFLNGQHHFISGSPIVSGKYFSEIDKQAI